MTRRVQVLWVPAVAAILAAEVLLLLVDAVGGRHAAEHTSCGTAWLLVSFALAPGIPLAVGLLAAAPWHGRAGAGSSTGHPSAAGA